MVRTGKAFGFGITGMLLLTLLVGGPAQAGGTPAIRVAISLDIPPYVMQHAATGLEVDILRRALAGQDLRFVQLPYEELQTAVQKGAAEVSVGVQPFDSGVFYSKSFITFANFAISRQADHIAIASVDDLKHHRVLTWEKAYLELGPEFEAIFSPQSPYRKNYTEIADQEEQVRRFWAEPGQVIIIDLSIFNYFSRQQGHPPEEAALHPIFPPVTNFKVSFREAALRDSFDRGLADLCASGAYADLLEDYQVRLQKTVCE